MDAPDDAPNLAGLAALAQPGWQRREDEQRRFEDELRGRGATRPSGATAPSTSRTAPTT